MVEHKLVTGLVLDSDNKPDPICELCIAGKMSANPFPLSANHNRSPPALAHSDLHEPLPVATHQGYKYWITFIDDSTCFRSIHLLKSKSQAFEAFKDYKAWAENQLSAKILELQDDKGMNICPRNSCSLLPSMVFKGVTQLKTDLSKMALLNEPTELWEIALQLY